MEEINNMFTKVRIYGTFENPLFVANDIGKILNIIKIRNSIQDYKHNEIIKDAHIMGG